MSASPSGARIADAGDIARALAVVRDKAGRRGNTSEMTHAVGTADGLPELNPAPALPVHDALAELLPWRGLRRGAVVGISGSAGLLLALLGEASAAGSWCAVVNFPGLSPVAAAETGVELARLALVPHPGAQWLEATSVLMDGFDIVLWMDFGPVRCSVASSVQWTTDSGEA
ncbi:hypothetical protein [Catellatospora sp. NPDC049133]|uniref:hypothetical protein n=1 Tax=Catellatospora sp. NPDC049133 TaxID=3155499 RepID=UPI0033CF7ABD